MSSLALLAVGVYLLGYGLGAAATQVIELFTGPSPKETDHEVEPPTP